VAVEMAATVVVQIDLIKGWSIPGVRLETEDFIMAVGSARPMEDAARMAYRDLIRWMVADYGFEETRPISSARRRARCGWATWSTRSTRWGVDAEDLSGLREDGDTKTWIWD
jgi:hypothetical protein